MIIIMAITMQIMILVYGVLGGVIIGKYYTILLRNEITHHVLL